MSLTDKPLNFIEQIIETSLADGLPVEKLRFRFPPEPNGYLHIGHAKSICLNFGLGLKYQAPVNLRFDDTNPAKEEQEYVDAIKEDIQWLGFKWDKELYSSDYFQQLYDWAVLMIKNDKAYVDSQSSEEMALQKGTPTQAGINSPYRNRTIAENLSLFEAMKNGEFAESTHVLRAKIDMASPNMLMRDPLMYRILHRHHHRTGNDWKIYPMYDYAHGESDYVEGISHSICTLEFDMHRELYNWFLDQIASEKAIRPNQYEFARLNLNYTIMSKRKLLQLVQDKVVSGWDDPRMPTISGLRRRGYTPTAIRNFCDTIGVAKRENGIDVSLLEFCLREDLNKTATRVMAVLDPLKLVITNFPKDKTLILKAENNPENPEAGYRDLPFSKELFIEREDFLEEAPAKFFRLSLGKEVRLKNAFIIKAESVVKDTHENVIEVHATYDEDSLSGSNSEASKRKVSGTLHWVSVADALEVEVRLYDRLFTDEAPDSYKQKSFLDFVNPKSLQIITAFVEPNLKSALPNDIFQFQRMGYFCVDKESTTEKLVFNKTVGLKDSWEEKDKSETNLIVNIQKELNKLVKEKDTQIVDSKLIEISKSIQSIDGFSVLNNAFVKNIKNDNTALLFSNLLLHFSTKIKPTDFENTLLEKLYNMSLKSQLALTRIFALKNLKNDVENGSKFQNQILDFSKTEKNEKVLEVLKSF
jgi:glutaminyl-tRNA synthetase